MKEFLLEEICGVFERFQELTLTKGGRTFY